MSYRTDELIGFWAGLVAFSLFVAAIMVAALEIV